VVARGPHPTVPHSNSASVFAEASELQAMRDVEFSILWPKVQESVARPVCYEYKCSLKSETMARFAA